MEKTKDKNKKNGYKIAILMGVGAIIDLGQAVIVYNTGKGAEAKSLGQNYKWSMPSGKELAKTAGIVLATSLLTGILVGVLEKVLLEDKPKEVTV